MKFIRVYTDRDGTSHLEPMKLDFKANGPKAKRAVLKPVKAVYYGEGTNRTFADWHTAPARQYVITLGGRMEVRAGDGAVEVLGPGDILFADDTTGKGHVTTFIDPENRASLTLPLVDQGRKRRRKVAPKKSTSNTKKR